MPRRRTLKQKVRQLLSRTSTSTSGTLPLLPNEAYPAQLDAHARLTVDQRLRELEPTIPTTPGQYLDRDGSPWTLGSDGRWTDSKGNTRDQVWNPILGLYGPWSPAPTSAAETVTPGLEPRA